MTYKIYQCKMFPKVLYKELVIKSLTNYLLRSDAFFVIKKVVAISLLITCLI